MTEPKSKPEPLTGLVIRAIEPDDWPQFAAMRREPGVYANTLGMPHPRAADWRKKLETPPEGAVNLGSFLQGELIGVAGLFRSEGRRHHTADLGMAVRDAYVGRGVGTALLGALVDLADNWINLKRIGLTVFTGNAPAIGLYERFGFEREGLLRAYAFRDGHYVDALAMARVRL